MGTKTVLITGAGGGLGSAAARRLAANGWSVIAADYSDQALESLADVPNLTSLKLDVTSEQDVARAFETVAASHSALDGIVNFAGVLGVGSVAEISDTALQRVLDVNVMGTFRVNKTFLPLVEAARGRIVTISSETGWQSAAPFNGPYAMSKHAIEAYSDSLRRELAMLGIKVIKIQPGPFRTSMVEGIKAAFQAAEDQSSHFKTTIANLKHLAAREAESAHDPDVLAAVIEKALTVKNPKAAYSVRPDRVRVLISKLPTPVADRLWHTILTKLGARPRAS